MSQTFNYEGHATTFVDKYNEMKQNDIDTLQWHFFVDNQIFIFQLYLLMHLLKIQGFVCISFALSG